MLNEFLKNNFMLNAMQTKLISDLTESVQELKETQMEKFNSNCEDFDFDKNAEITDKQFNFDYEEDFDY